MQKKLIAAGSCTLLLLASQVTFAGNLVTNGNFESGGLDKTTESINGATGPFGVWLANGGWTISSGQASNASDFAENPDYNYILMQGIDLSGYSSAFQTSLSFDYAYEGGFGGLDGRGVRVFGMQPGDTEYKFFVTGTSFSTLDLLFSAELQPTGNPTNAFVGFTSGAFTVDPTQFSALLLVYTFGGCPTCGELRAVDNVYMGVPEPGTLALLGLGLVGLGLSWRRKAA